MGETREEMSEKGLSIEDRRAQIRLAERPVPFEYYAEDLGEQIKSYFDAEPVFTYMTRIEASLASSAARVEELEADRLQTAIDVLEEYFKKHAMGVNAVIQSEWARGVFSGRKEAVNILKAALAKSKEVK